MRMADDLLLAMARSGDCGAIARFATRWWTPIFRFAFNMLGNGTQAAAVTEETVFLLIQPGPIECAVQRLVFRAALDFALLRRRWTPHPVDRHSPMRGALLQLSHLDRAALLLREVERLRVEEIAAILRTSQRDVRDRAHRACLLLTESADLALVG